MLFCIYFFKYHRFILIDLGGFGRQSDGGVFTNSIFGASFEEGQMGLPNLSALPEKREPELPFVLVGDEAFPLKTISCGPILGIIYHVCRE